MATEGVSHPRLHALREQARALGAAPGASPMPLALAWPCDALALQAAQAMAAEGLAQPILVGPRARIEAAAQAAQVSASRFAVHETPDDPAQAATAACLLAREGSARAVMKGSLHTDELMRAINHRRTGLHGDTRLSHAFVFDLPAYPKLLAVADAVVNVDPNIRTKRDILGNAVALLQRLGVAHPKVAVVAAVETPMESIPATMDAQALAQLNREGHWPGAVVEGPMGLDMALSEEAARTKGVASSVAGQADLIVVPELNSGNLLYKSLVYLAGAQCAGLVLGTRVPVVLTSRADSLQTRLASVALAVLAGQPGG